tara:strand:+ start:543 stop:2165 length:1623 start_codon:yes stop_codon:yes gene_type:complete
MKTITNIVYNFVRKQLAKNNMGQGKGITSLPNAADIEIGMTNIYNNLRKGGFDAVSAGKAIKSEDDLARTLSEIKQKEISDQQFFNQDPNRLDIIMDKMNRGIPLNKGDQFALEGSGFKTQLDAFRGFEPKVIQGGKSEKELLEKMNKQNKEAVERIKKRKDTDPDKKAEGGRIGYLKGGVAALLKLLQNKVGKKAITTADKIDRPESAKLRDEFKAFEKRMGNRKLTNEEYAELEEIYGDSLPYLETVDDAKKYVAEQKAYEAAMARDYRAGKLDPKPGEPGRKEFLEKKMEEMEMSGDTKLMTRDEIEELEGFNLDTEMGEFINKAKQKDLQQKRALEEFDVTDRTKQAEGGLTRLGFANGSPPSKGRRNFLKLMGGLAALPVVGKFFKFAKPTSTAVQAAKEAAGVPSYFPKLVEKIKLLGDDVTSTRATGERQIVKEYKGYELTESLDTGSLTIKRDGYTSEEYLEYIPGGQYYDETRKKVIKYPDSYEEVTVKPDYEGKMKDVDFGLDSYDEILEEVGEAKIKKAGGGLAYMLGM